MSESVIEARGLRKRFGWGRRRVDALRGVDLDVRAGRVTGLIGPNGAGKSTFIKLVLGFLVPSEGTVRLLGDSPGDAHAHARLGYLPENPSFPVHLRGRELMHYSAALLGLERRRAMEQAEELLAEVAITDAAGRPIREYSKGMRQRLGLAQAMLGAPDLLILDEPMSGLDPVGRAAVKRMLRSRRASGTSILFCSHILDDVEQLSDDVTVFSEGRVHHAGPVAEILAASGDRWSVFVRCVEPPDLESGSWESVGRELWSGQDLSRADVANLHRAAAEGRLDVLRLQQAERDLEGRFLQLSSGVPSASEEHPDA